MPSTRSGFEGLWHNSVLPGGGGLLPYKGQEANGDVPLDGVTFSIELLEWGRTFSDFGGKTVLHIYGWQTYQNVCTVDL